MATPSDVADRYRLERRLGAGGMSTVFLAADTVLERPVAVKLLAEHLAEDEAFVARFRREAVAAARLQHPNIVQVYDSGRDPTTGRHYIVMEYVDGPSCADLLREHGRLEIEETVRIVADACHGLDYAHRAGVVHRDVKPGNLLVSSETGVTKLADFGIAKAAEQTKITQVGSVLGTAAYLSPEQARGDEAGPRSDIYSLGVCTYQFLAGQLPHQYSSLTELALKQQEETVEPIRSHRPEVPAELDRAVRLCLAQAPEDRYASALELARALEAGLRGEETAVTRRLAEAPGTDPGAIAPLGEAPTAATRVLGTRAAPTPTPAPAPVRRPVAPAPPRPAADPRRRAARRRLVAFLAFLAALAAIVVVALVLLTSSGNQSVQPVKRDEVRSQIQALRQFIREHSR
jgi:eukaryotic-like serine/threonine-protein kinase